MGGFYDPVGYSVCSAWTGSMRLARSAGTKAASAATVKRISGIAVNATTSRPCTPRASSPIPALVRGADDTDGAANGDEFQPAAHEHANDVPVDEAGGKNLGTASDARSEQTPDSRLTGPPPTAGLRRWPNASGQTESPWVLRRENGTPLRVPRTASACPGARRTEATTIARSPEPIAAPNACPSCPKTQTNSRLARRAVSIVIDLWRAPVLGRVGGDVGDSGSPYAQGKHRSARGATLPGGDLDPGPGRTRTRTC